MNWQADDKWDSDVACEVEVEFTMDRPGEVRVSVATDCGSITLSLDDIDRLAECAREFRNRTDTMGRDAA